MGRVGRALDPIDTSNRTADRDLLPWPASRPGRQSRRGGAVQGWSQAHRGPMSSGLDTVPRGVDESLCWSALSVNVSIQVRLDLRLMVAAKEEPWRMRYEHSEPA